VEVVLALLGALVAFVVLAFVVGTLVGRRLPTGHVASRSATFAAPPERVWEVITDPAFMRSRGVGGVKTETVESVPPRRLVRRIVGEKDFGGTWTSEISPEAGGGARLVITENGEVYNAFFRFVSRYIVGHHRTIDSFLTALHWRLDATGQ
jgi:hypothetical protein